MTLRFLCSFHAAGLAASLLLAGCSLNAPFFYPEWIEVPLVADGQIDVLGAGYQAWGKTLQVSDSSQVPLKFSLATLPSGTLPSLRKSNDTVTESSLPYSLNAAKVVKARLVFLVSEVNRPGYIAVDALFAPSGDCYAQESAEPACSNTSAMSGLARDTGGAAEPLLIAHGGLHSVDVTDLVKQRITLDSLVLRLRAAANPVDGSFGDFELDSKDQDRFGTMVQGARLLVSLSDAMGAPTNLHPYSGLTANGKDYLVSKFNMRRDSDDSAVIHTVFQNSKPLLVQDTQGGDGAFFSFAPSQLGAGQLQLLQGQQAINMGVKQVGVLDIEGPVSNATPIPALQWHSVFRDMSSPPSWSTWDDATNTPPAKEPVATSLLPTGQQGARVIADTSAAMVQQTLANVALSGDYAKTHYSVLTISGNTLEPLKISNVASAQPRLITSITPKPTQSVAMSFVEKESQPADFPWCICIFREETTCNPGSRNDYSVKARIGKAFDALQVIPYTSQGGLMPSASEIHLWAPPPADGQPTSLLDRDRTNLGVNSFIESSFNQKGGYMVFAGTANRVVGEYTGYITRPGRNTPLPIYYSNLPLPVPSLQGPSQLTLPLPQQGEVLAQEASFEFLVDDAVAQLDDDTIYWNFASSVAGDATPGTNVKQGNGSKTVRFAFQTRGPRRLTVTSRGDSEATAFIDVQVSAATATRLGSSVASPVYGQPFELIAEVQSPYVAPGGVLKLIADDIVLGTALLDTTSEVRFSAGLLEPGSHIFSAKYEGHSALGLSGSSSAATSITVQQAQSLTQLTLPSSFTPGLQMQAHVQVSASAPSLALPDGEVMVQGAGGSCIAVLQQGRGTCTLTPLQGGAQAFTANYVGNSRVAGSSASQALAILKLPSQTSLQLPASLKLGQSANFTAKIIAVSASTIQPRGTILISGAGSSCSATLDAQGLASCSFTPTTAGKDLPFSASYAGDESFEASSSPAQLGLVAGWTSQLEMSATSNPVTARAEVVFALRVSRADLTSSTGDMLLKAADVSPSGSISLSDNGQRLGEAALLGSDGTASLSTRDLRSVGAHTITAHYSGDESHEPAMLSLVIEVNAAPDPTPVPIWAGWARALL